MSRYDTRMPRPGDVVYWQRPTGCGDWPTEGVGVIATLRDRTALLRDGTLLLHDELGPRLQNHIKETK